MIWERIPKSHFVALDNLELSVYDAMCTFNVGNKKASSDILLGLNVEAFVQVLQK